MSPSLFGTAAVLALLCGWSTAQAGATDLPRCPPQHHHRHVARRAPAQVVYGRAEVRHPVYNYEDNGRYDGADLPSPGTRAYPVGQPPSWLDGYGTRPVTYAGYGTTNAYGGSAQVMPYGILPGIPPAGGLAVYSAGAYGPGPRIIHVPEGY